MYQQYYPTPATWAQHLPPVDTHRYHDYKHQGASSSSPTTHEPHYWPTGSPQQPPEYFDRPAGYHDNKMVHPFNLVKEDSKLGQVDTRLSPATCGNHGYQQPVFTYMYSRVDHSRESPCIDADPMKTEPNMPLNFSMDKKDKMVGSRENPVGYPFHQVEYTYHRDLPVGEMGYFPASGVGKPQVRTTAFDWINTNKHRQEVQAKPGLFIIYFLTFIYFLFVINVITNMYLKPFEILVIKDANNKRSERKCINSIIRCAYLKLHVW